MKKTILLALISSLIVITSCNQEESDGKSLKIKIDGKIINLADAFIYLAVLGDYDAVDNQSENLTHSYTGVYITDQDWTLQDSPATYEVFIYIEYPLDQTGGEFELMSYSNFIEWPFTFNAGTRLAHAEIIYNYIDTGTHFSYDWIGFDPTNPDSDDIFSVTENEDESLRFELKADGDTWIYDSADNWTAIDSDIKFSVYMEGQLIDVTTEETARYNHTKSLRYQQLKKK